MTHPQIPPFNPTHGATNRLFPPALGFGGYSDGQFLSTFAAPPVDDRTTTGSTHAFAKAVLVSSLAVTRLKCAFHGGNLRVICPEPVSGSGTWRFIVCPNRRMPIQKNRDDSTICQIEYPATETSGVARLCLSLVSISGFLDGFPRFVYSF